MLGKPEWFSRRKYGGWGVFPKTWQGWAYIAAFVGVLAVVQILPFGSQTKVLITFIIAAIIAADTVHIMLTMPRDERERVHEAIAERNALWAMLAVLVIGVAEQTAASVVNNTVRIDPVILFALAAALLAKAATNIYLDRRD